MESLFWEAACVLGQGLVKFSAGALGRREFGSLEVGLLVFEMSRKGRVAT